MRFWKNVTIGRQVGLGFALMGLLILVGGASGVASSWYVQAGVDETYQVHLQGLQQLLEADRDLYQLLTAERSLMFVEPGSPAFAKWVDEYETNLAQSVERVEKYAALAPSDAERRELDAFRHARTEWEAISRRAIKARQAGATEAVALTLGEAAAAFDRMREHINLLEEISAAGAGKNYERASLVYSVVSRVLGALTLLGLAIGLTAAWLITSRVAKRVAAASRRLRESGDQLVSAAGQVASSAQALSQSSSEQAATLEETAAAIEEVSAMTRQNAEHSVQAAALMGEVDGRVAASNGSLGGMVASMNAIRESSARVSKIIKTIDEIAFQTNILALNAAVEAARAGEAGMGFAVVADEVRSLAQRAGQSANDTTALIEDSIAKTNEGAQKVDQLTASMTAIVESVERARHLVDEVSRASAQQARGIEQVSTGVVQLEKMTQSNAASAEEQAAASEELNAQAATSQDAVAELEALVGGRKAARL